MRITEYLTAGAIGLGAILAGCSGVANSDSIDQKVKNAPKTAQVARPQPVTHQTQQEAPKPKPLTEERVAELMKKDTVDDILAEVYKSGTVQQVTYDERRRTTNYDQLVFQRDLKPEERKPVLVMFYIDKDKAKNETTYNFSKREAIVFRQLAELYHNQIKFVLLKESNDPKFSRELRARRTPYGIRAIPSIAVYSPWDVAKGETPKKHDGRVTQVDILRGGPKDNNWAVKWGEAFPKYWIEPNLTNPNGGYTQRFNNSSSIKKQVYSKKVDSR